MLEVLKSPLVYRDWTLWPLLTKQWSVSLPVWRLQLNNWLPFLPFLFDSMHCLSSLPWWLLWSFTQKEVASSSEVHSITTVLRLSTGEAFSYCLSLYANRETNYQYLKNLTLLSDQKKKESHFTYLLCQFSFLIQTQIADFIWPTNVVQEQANLGKLFVGDKVDEKIIQLN